MADVDIATKERLKATLRKCGKSVTDSMDRLNPEDLDAVLVSAAQKVKMMSMHQTSPNNVHVVDPEAHYSHDHHIHGFHEAFSMPDFAIPSATGLMHTCHEHLVSDDESQGAPSLSTMNASPKPDSPKPTHTGHCCASRDTNPCGHENWNSLFSSILPPNAPPHHVVYNLTPEYYMASREPSSIVPYILPYSRPQNEGPFEKHPLPMLQDSIDILTSATEKLESHRAKIRGEPKSEKERTRNLKPVRSILHDVKIWEAMARIMRETQLSMMLIGEIVKVLGDFQETFRTTLMRLAQHGTFLKGWKPIVKFGDLSCVFDHWNNGEKLRKACEKVVLRMRKSGSIKNYTLEKPELEFSIHHPIQRVPVHALKRRTEVLLSLPSRRSTAETVKGYIRGEALKHDLKYVTSTATKAILLLLETIRAAGRFLVYANSLEAYGPPGWPEEGKEVWLAMDDFMTGFSSWYTEVGIGEKLDEAEKWNLLVERAAQGHSVIGTQPKSNKVSA